MRFKKRQHSVIEQIRRHDRRLAIIELGKSHLAVGIDKRLLIDWSHPLESPDIKGVLSAAVSRTFALELPVRFFCPVWLSPKPPPALRLKSILPANSCSPMLRGAFLSSPDRDAAKRNAPRPLRSLP